MFRFNLENKFVGLALAIILFASYIANIGIVGVYRNQLFQEAEKRAHLLTESTGIFFTNTLLYQELGLVEEGGLIENHINDLTGDPNTEILSVDVWNEEGRIVASSNYNRYFEPAPGDSIARLEHAEEPRLVDHPSRHAFSVFYPLKVSSKYFGLLRIEFSRAEEIARLANFKKLMFLISIAFTVLGTLIAFLVARALARPIKKLASEMGRVADPGYKAQLSGTRKDEIGDLERTFMNMLSRLKAAADEKERQQRNLIQTEKLASVGTLVSGLAHEINNPLAGIRNCLRRITAKPEDMQQTQKYTALMDKALQRIENIVRDLLNFSRNKELLLQPVNLNAIIEAAHNLVALRLKRQHVHIDLQLDENLPQIEGDPQHLEQVYVNLLLNAIDATGEGGKISIRTGVQKLHVISEVTDTGPGIPSDIRHKIFDPFFTTKPVGSGTGLGLSVTKAIVEEHKGEIEVRSTGQGTTFRLRFPTSAHIKSKISRVSAAVLAGGKSSRMGQDKALIAIEGKPMIQHVVETIQSCIQDIVIISNRPDRLTFLNRPVYPDSIESCGPLAGIYTALKHVDTKHCLVVACDLPFVTRPLIQFLCENASRYDVFAFESDTGVEPLCAVYSKNCLPVIETQIRSGNFKVTDFFARVETRIVHLSPELLFYDSNTFFNVNTRKELQKARSFVRKFKPEEHNKS